MNPFHLTLNLCYMLRSDQLWKILTLYKIVVQIQQCLKYRYNILLKADVEICIKEISFGGSCVTIVL